MVQWRKRKLLYPHPKLSLGLVPYRPFTLKYVDVACKKNDVLDYSFDKQTLTFLFLELTEPSPDPSNVDIPATYTGIDLARCQLRIWSHYFIN